MPSNPTTQQDPVKEKLRPVILFVCSICDEPLSKDAISFHEHTGTFAPVEYVPAKNKQQQARIEELEGALRGLRAPSGQHHSYMASTFRSGQWRHQCCSACAAEERADLALSPTQPDAPEGPCRRCDGTGVDPNPGAAGERGACGKCGGTGDDSGGENDA